MIKIITIMFNISTLWFKYGDFSFFFLQNMVSFKDFFQNKSFVQDAIVFFGAKHCEISPTKTPQFGIEKSNKQYIV